MVQALADLCARTCYCYEERLRKIWIMERDKVEAIYDDLKEKETLAELEAEETQEEEAE